MSEVGTDVVGVDFRVPLDEAARRVGPEFALQGNLDPAACCSPGTVVAGRVDDVLTAAKGLPGTSSTWATGCCRAPILGCWRRW